MNLYRYIAGFIELYAPSNDELDADDLEPIKKLSFTNFIKNERDWFAINMPSNSFKNKHKYNLNLYFKIAREEKKYSYQHW